MNKNPADLSSLFSLMFQAHPWHGVSAGDNAPTLVNVFIEIVPNDNIKYELDKPSGRLRIDRPQRFSSLCPLPYGFVPQTFCGDSIAEFCMEKTGRTGITGDGDPLDICVLTETTMAHGNFLLKAKPIGGLRMIDKNEADDKIIAVLYDDVTFGNLEDIADCPPGQIERLRHYFLTYKQLPTERERYVEITDVYGREEAFQVIRRSQADYRATFGAPETRLDELKRLLQA
ncbi:MAG: inorganic pyrophosphatase [Pyrinomonadaceae bacterium]